MDYEDQHTEQRNDRDTEDKSLKKNSGKSSYGKGLFIGVLSGIGIMLMAAIIVISVVFRLGFIHIGMNGEIYVQDLSTSGASGVGSEVESKLNSLDSLLDYFYFDDVDQETAKANIYKAFLASFGDQYTVYYTSEEYKLLMESTNGTFYGIGAVCQKQEDGSILIIDAYEDAPAYKAGIRTGDIILRIDGTDISEMDLSTAVALIKGDKGSTVTLEGLHGNQEFSITVTRDKVSEKTVAYELREDGIGYIEVSQFEKVTTKQFKEAVDELTNMGMKGLVIDIRSNPGGLLATVVDILDYILPEGLLVYTEDKNGSRTEYKGKDSAELSIPIAVLVNENSASASEIFAGAMQDYGKGEIIGTQTFGKGIVQTIRQLTDGSAVKFTIAKYFTPLGQDIHGKGVTPDQVVELDLNAEEDTQLKAAYEYLEAQIQ